MTIFAYLWTLACTGMLAYIQVRYIPSHTPQPKRRSEGDTITKTLATSSSTESRAQVWKASQASQQPERKKRKSREEIRELSRTKYPAASPNFNIKDCVLDTSISDDFMGILHDRTPLFRKTSNYSGQGKNHAALR